MGISREETIAFGDNINDIAMLEYAGKGYAVDTARKETKEAADEIIPGYAEDGVLKVLKTFCLEHMGGEKTWHCHIMY